MENYTEILTKYWGYSGFRPLQLDIILSVAAGKDTLGLMPTGGGKSITFQVYSLSKGGVCLVVTPLIALMKDQVENLTRRGIKAHAIYSGMSALEIKLALDNVVWGQSKFLYISPERLSTPRFRERLNDMDVNLIAVDEAHCISQWGYDFRPSYLKITELRSLLPNVPILALTATATPRVVKDIQEKLRFTEENLLKQSFARENLVYLVREKEDKQKYLLQSILKSQGSGIVYVRRKKFARELAEFLSRNKISADYYHAGLNPESRSLKQDLWKMGKTRVIVATNAFGMGIDKPDVRFVIHHDPPESLEAYYQEAGRAGRDGKKAAAVLLFNSADKLKLKKNIIKAFPDVDSIKKVYQALGNFFQIAEGFGKDAVYDFNIGQFAEAYHFQLSLVFSSLRILQREGYIEFTDEVDSPSKVYFIISRDDLYKFQVANASFDGFIKLLLRSYTGLFSGYTPVDEELLAKRASISGDDVYQFLTRLRILKVIDYIPRKRTPFLIFTKERVNPGRVTISKENYDDRKKDYQERIDAVIGYAASNNRCRSQVLLEYFGEADAPECGVCDVCQSHLKMAPEKDEYERISAQTREILQNPCTYENLLLRLQGNEETSIRVVRWLMDNKKIVYRVDNKLEWKG